jgi:large subunit ribosomal protein L31
MKEGIHPEYHKVLVSCACGNQFETHSTKKDIRLELCSACHPFFTGKQKLVDTAGRIERFNKRYGKINKDDSAKN